MSFETAIEYFELPGERNLSFLPAVISNTCVYSNYSGILSNDHDHDHDDDDNDGLPELLVDTFTSDIYSNSPAILSNDHDHDDDDDDGLPELLVDTFTSDVYSNSPAILSTMSWKGNNSPPF